MLPASESCHRRLLLCNSFVLLTQPKPPKLNFHLAPNALQLVVVSFALKPANVATFCLHFLFTFQPPKPSPSGIFISTLEAHVALSATPFQIPLSTVHCINDKSSLYCLDLKCKLLLFSCKDPADIELKLWATGKVIQRLRSSSNIWYSDYILEWLVF